jgi:hypothetical protein
VLIDIAGSGRGDNANDKRDKLRKWIKKHQHKMEQYKIKQLQGIVIAPNVKEKSYQDEEVLMVCGKDAICLLSGLGQIQQWLI